MYLEVEGRYIDVATGMLGPTHAFLLNLDDLRIINVDDGIARHRAGGNVNFEITSICGEPYTPAYLMRVMEQLGYLARP